MCESKNYSKRGEKGIETEQYGDFVPLNGRSEGQKVDKKNCF